VEVAELLVIIAELEYVFIVRQICMDISVKIVKIFNWGRAAPITPYQGHTAPARLGGI